jgi:2',3'-cyclic-nucleotide 2'-phosphodiesterase (5'-nucleotidase family)
VIENKKTDPKMVAMVDHYKKRMDENMGKVIGRSDLFMNIGLPESLLTNFTSDIMLRLDIKYTEGQTVDLSIMNVNGHRSPIPKGDITVGDVFSTYSFDNELVIVRLKGNYLTDVFKAYAGRGGSGISYNVKLIIKDKKLIDAKVNGKQVDDDKIYAIVTIDYLAEGNDAMDALKNAESVTQAGITLRDYMMDYIKEEAQAGRSISSKTDGRIIVE